MFFFNLTKIEKRWILLALAIILLYLSPLFVLGENAHIRVHDNLDSNLAWYKVLVTSGQLFGKLDATIPQIINGLPRNALASELNGIVWLYALFPTMIAYGLSQAITRIVAFIGMYILLKKHFLKGNEWVVINVGTALAFSLTPFWPSGMLSTLGMPLALWAFLNIRNGEKTWKNYIVLILLPFYSSFVLGFFFFLTAMGILWVVDGLRGKGWNFRFFFAIVLMLVVFMIVEYRLVASFFYFNEPNSRDEYFHARLPLWRVIRLTFTNFILGHNHVMTVHGLIILPVTIMALYAIFIKKLWSREKAFTFFFIINFALSTWYAFWFYKGWLPLTQRFHVMDTFNFARFHFLRPILIYIGFALGLKILWENRFFSKRIVLVILCLQLIVLLIFNDEVIYHRKPTVKEFFATELFDEIKDFIDLPLDQFRVASIGLHPAIAQYNGFYTLDTYNNFYPLRYKYKFRKIIEKELEKNKTIRTYFDEWGGRCYIFTDELGKHYMFKKNSQRSLENLELNTEAFKKLGGDYIFSAVPILNASENQIVLKRVFTSESAAWKIYLYQVIA